MMTLGPFATIASFILGTISDLKCCKELEKYDRLQIGGFVRYMSKFAIESTILGQGNCIGEITIFQDSIPIWLRNRDWLEGLNDINIHHLSMTPSFFLDIHDTHAYVRWGWLFE